MTTFLERRPYAALAVILLSGLIVRVYLLPTAGFTLDLEQHYYWSLCANRDGIFAVYTCEDAYVAPTHPPLSPTMLAISMGLLERLGGDVSYYNDNPAVVIALKLPNLLFETALIALLFRIALEKAGARWAALVTAALYWNPGWLIVTAWWGQNDATYSFFILLVAYFLTKDRPRLLWIAYGAAMLAKFQTIVFLPVLVVICWRRYKLRENLEGAVMGMTLFGVVMLPFLIGSGQTALRPFLGTVNLFPYVTNGAYNAWYLISGSPLSAVEDNIPFIGGVTYRTAGYIALAVGTLILCLRAWVLADRRDEYLLLTAASFSFVMLPTQVGARYFYPGLMLLVLAMISDRRLIALYVGLAITFTYNIFDLVWLGVGLLYYPSLLMFWSETVNALILTGLYIVFMAIFLQPLLARRRSTELQRTSA